METCVTETRDGGGNSLCPCVSPLHSLFFLAPINTFRCLLRRLHRSETSLTFLNSLTWAMLRYASLNFSKTNTNKESVLSLDSFIKHGLLYYWCCFMTVFVSPCSKIAAAYFRSLRNACICHNARELVLQSGKSWHPFHSGWTKSITLSSHPHTMDPCLLSRRLKILCEKEQGAWWKHARWRHVSGEGTPSALVCLPCTPCSFWHPLILSGACYAGYTGLKLHWPCWILWLGLCSDMPLLISVRQTLSC